jgi:hypothetical protein
MVAYVPDGEGGSSRPWHFKFAPLPSRAAAGGVIPPLPAGTLFARLCWPGPHRGLVPGTFGPRLRALELAFSSGRPRGSLPRPDSQCRAWALRVAPTSPRPLTAGPVIATSELIAGRHLHRPSTRSSAFLGRSRALRRANGHRVMRSDELIALASWLHRRSRPLRTIVGTTRDPGDPAAV